MKSVFDKSHKWRAVMVLAPLALLVVLAIVTLGLSGAAGVTVYANSAPADQYGIGNQLLYVANGQASNVKVIDVGSMSVVDTIPIPNEITPGAPGGATYATLPWDGGTANVNLHALNTGLMNWEVHGVVPSADRHDVYAVGALSGGSYASPGVYTDGTFNAGDYKLYKVNTATKALDRETSIAGAGQPVNPVGYCGLEYNDNDVNSNELVAASMNASNAVLLGALTVDLSHMRGTGANEHGGWSTVNVTTGANTGFLDTNSLDVSNQESSTCGIAWNQAGTHGYASQMYDALVDTINWSGGAGTVTGSIAAGPGGGYHQETTDPGANRMFAAEGRYIDVIDMNTNTHIAAIDMYALTGASTVDTHSVDFTDAGGHDILYATARHVPSAGSTTIVVLNVDNINNVAIAGETQGLDNEACGVYVDPDKSLYYKASGVTSSAQASGTTAPFTHAALGNDLLFVAGGRDSNIKVADPSSMSIVDRIPVPNEITPGAPGGATYATLPWDGGTANVNLHALNPSLMNWEVHSIIVSSDRTKVYVAGALSGGSYATPNVYTDGTFNAADYKLYTIGTGTKALQREDSLAGAGQPVNPVGYCGLEYDQNNEASSTVVAASMNASNSTLIAALGGADLSHVRGTGASEHGGWTSFNLSTHLNSGFLDMYTTGEVNQESSTCGIAWATPVGGRTPTVKGFASQMFQPLVDTLEWNSKVVNGSIPPSVAPGTSYHQATYDKAHNILYVASSSGNVDVFNGAATPGSIIGSIRVRELTGAPSVDVHGVELSPSDPSVLYITARNVPDAPAATAASEVIVRVDDTTHPSTSSHLLGVIPGMGAEACGVYAIPDKTTWQTVQNGTKPSLSLTRGNVYWASYDDYVAHKLSADYSISAGATSSAASNVQITSADFDRAGVSLASAMPISVGNISAGGSAGFTLKYDVSGIAAGSKFWTTTHASADGGLWTYP